jgi:hypothetical protein
MKVIVAGSREIVDYDLVIQAIKESGFEVTQVISGTARGVDTLGARYGKENNIPVREMSANWDQWGKMAGFKRNEEMAQVADALIAIWDGQSKGTRNMISIAKRYNLRTYVKRTDVNPTELGI